MDRRAALRFAAVGCAAAIAPSIARAGFAQACYREGRHTVHCQVGFAQTPLIEETPCQEDCWIGCLSYLMRGYGADVTSADVAERMGKGKTCRSLDEAQQLQRAQGTWRDRRGRQFLVRVQQLSDLRRGSYGAEEFQGLTDALSRRPLIVVGAKNAMVLTELAYFDAPMVWTRPKRLVVRDPWTGTPNLRNVEYEAMPEKLSTYDLRIRAL